MNRASRNPPDTRTTRAVRLLVRLIRRGRATTRELASDIGEDVRPVREDLRLLAQVAPVRAVGDREHRYWELDTGLSLEGRGVLDRIALELGRQVISFMRGTALEAESFAPLDRLDPRYSRNLKHKLWLLHEPGREYASHAETLDTVLDGLLRELRLSFDYVGASGKARRYEGFEPLSLVVYRRAVYLCGHPAGEDAVHRLAVERISDPVTGGSFPYPTDWRPQAELDRWFGIFAPAGRDARPEPVVLRFSAKVAPYVRARRWHRTESRVEMDGGGIELRMHTGGKELVRFCLEWGEHCEVIEPDWLRRDVRAELEGALRLHEEPPPEELCDRDVPF